MSMAWLIILVGLIVVVIIVQFSHLRHRFKLASLVLFLLFLYISFIKVNPGGFSNINSLSEFYMALKNYVYWITHVFINLKTITGNVVRMEWGGNFTR
jgi:hypothetical protein